ncbi:MAG: hypothetical protein GFH27_549291n133 [Chloroflexi bacterium AL-W]|nr:hypothetical protein [Chloroflexi bacterium AL-N1]NOK67400.1 hypothetical protein [Chloroflexi bacterium AL-N10]NOK75108.1 hypothetical protein [Chloroflexi bacterium AL-N5]NOK81895.1 hypothetical protein [Chloroflexi bacterium AL-W]NOK89741.1 hypothetical protein [Chloroflexi bacterium AL-N15]
MHLKVLACNLDHIWDANNDPIEEIRAILSQAKVAGMHIILVTRYTLDDLAMIWPYINTFKAVVAEDGAVIYFPECKRTIMPFGYLDPMLLPRLEKQGIPLTHGEATARTWLPYDAAVLDVLRIFGGGALIEYNNDVVMIQPTGATKGTGLAYVLRELALSPHNVVVCGGDENDRSLFEMAELSIAFADAVPAIRTLADMVLPHTSSTGLQTLIANLSSGQIPHHRSQYQHQLLLGHQSSGTPVYLSPPQLLHNNIGIFGDSGSGKSWLAGVLVEEMLKQGYQVCVIDPEGDHHSLSSFPHTLLVGGSGARLPPVVDLVELCKHTGMSLIVDLSTCLPTERVAYVVELIHALRLLRHTYGRPHWILIDEIQHFCPFWCADSTQAIVEAMNDQGFGIVSYLPNVISELVLNLLNGMLLLQFDLAEKIATLASHLGTCDTWPSIALQITDLPQGHAWMCFHQSVDDLNGSTLFRSRPRMAPHMRHFHKYLHAILPEAVRFYFCDGTGEYVGFTAANLWEFREALYIVPIDSLQYHSQRGDFERWIREVIRNDDLARQLAKLPLHELTNTVLRQKLISLVSEWCEELEHLV